MKQTKVVLISVILLTMMQGSSYSQAPPAERKDHHSYSNPEQVKVRHVDLEWDVLFDQKILRGTAVLSLERTGPDKRAPLILDTRNLNISKAEASLNGAAYSEAKFTVGKADPILGAPLTIDLPEQAARVRVTYSTSPGASGLQWLEPSQTAEKKHPFMFTQSEAIHARSWIPLQDTPQARLTYTARVHTPRDLVAVMSAENDPQTPRDGDYSFKMSEPIPSYLIALAVGDLAFKSLGTRTGVYAERSVVDKAAAEFADTEKMVKATESLYGPYRWSRYDLLVLPPSFPFGGMENPRLTFATPTVLAGDKSLVSLVAHELAHSWSGNLVTNATWDDFWLNEGFTTYIENRIMERLYGAERARMLEVLGRQELLAEFARFGADSGETVLHIDLTGRDPDEGSTQVPYEKGQALLRTIEAAVGRGRFDAWLRGYFDRHAFTSLTTADFLTDIRANLIRGDRELEQRLRLDEWVSRPGLPSNAFVPTSDAFAKVEGEVRRFTAGTPAASLATQGWSTQEWQHFLGALPAAMTPAHLGT